MTTNPLRVIVTIVIVDMTHITDTIVSLRLSCVKPLLTPVLLSKESNWDLSIGRDRFLSHAEENIQEKNGNVTLDIAFIPP